MGEVIGLHAGIEAVLLFLHYPWQVIVLFHVRRIFLSKWFGRPSTFVLLGHGLRPREKAREVGSRKRSCDLIFRSPKECKAEKNISVLSASCQLAEKRFYYFDNLFVAD
jgi:hypothetical protein